MHQNLELLSTSLRPNYLPRHFTSIFITFIHISQSANKVVTVKHAQLRMNCSMLNFDLFSPHVVDSPACPFGHNREDLNHYLLQCTLYFQARNKMLHEIRQLNIFHISGDLLLYGAAERDHVINCEIYEAVHDYIEEAGRL